MSAVIDIGTLIIQTPEVRGGRPRLAGTGVTVRRVVGWYKLGLTPEEIADRVGHLSLAQIHAALAYYHANREAIEADIAAEEVETARAARHWSTAREIPSWSGAAARSGRRHPPSNSGAGPLNGEW